MDGWKTDTEFLTLLFRSVLSVGIFLRPELSPDFPYGKAHMKNAWPKAVGIQLLKEEKESADTKYQVFQQSSRVPEERRK